MAAQRYSIVTDSRSSASSTRLLSDITNDALRSDQFDRVVTCWQLACPQNVQDAAQAILRPPADTAAVLVLNGGAWLRLQAENASTSLHRRTLTQKLRAWLQRGSLVQRATGVFSACLLLPLRRPTSLHPVAIVIPYICYSVDASGGVRLRSLAHRAVAHISLHAYLSTLGGGHFLCRHVEAALTTARLQAGVARAMGHAPLYRRCLLHIVYCYLQCGRFRSARKLNASIAQVAGGDDDLHRMCVAATAAIDRTAALWRQGKLQVVSGVGRELDMQRTDELYRQHLHGLRVDLSQGSKHAA